LHQPESLFSSCSILMLCSHKSSLPLCSFSLVPQYYLTVLFQVTLNCFIVKFQLLLYVANSFCCYSWFMELVLFHINYLVVFWVSNLTAGIIKWYVPMSNQLLSNIPADLTLCGHEMSLNSAIIVW
jgi:hypothetical protein